MKTICIMLWIGFWSVRSGSRISSRSCILLKAPLLFTMLPAAIMRGKSVPWPVWETAKTRRRGFLSLCMGPLPEQEGRPVSVDVYPGGTGDSKTLADQVLKLRQRFGLNRIVLVGDRGMITQTQIEYLEKFPGLGWISALRSASIRQLLEKGYLSISLFDTLNIAKICWPKYPNERFIACFNPLLAEERSRKRKELLEATEAGLRKIKSEVNRRTKQPLKESEIGLKVGRVINRFKVAKHFDLTIEDNKLEWMRLEGKIQQEEELDGIYIIRTSEPEESISAEDTVRQYKNLSRIEHIYRTVKGLDILIRPIRHRTEEHVRAHIFLCMLAYIVEWHMHKALAPILFEDEEVDSLRKTRDPVAKAEPSESAKRKKAIRVTSDGFPVHSFRTLLLALGKRCKNRCRLKAGGPETTFVQLTEIDALQRRAFELLGLMHPVG